MLICQIFQDNVEENGKYMYVHSELKIIQMLLMSTDENGKARQCVFSFAKRQNR